MSTQWVSSPHLPTYSPLKAKGYFYDTSFYKRPVSHKRPSSAILDLRSCLQSPEALHLGDSVKISSVVTKRGLPKHLVQVGEETPVL